MIRAIGIDSVTIARCSPWKHDTQKQLTRIFSPQEIAYCFEHEPSTLQRLAVRFAAKEATYKALCAAYPTLNIPFLTLCPLIELIQHPKSAPILSIAWSTLQRYSKTITPLISHVSATHTHTEATIIVILEE